MIPPANRADIGQDVDVIEEIARMIGFDRPAFQNAGDQNGQYSRQQKAA